MKTYFEWYDKYLWRVVYGAIIEPKYLHLDFNRLIKSGTIHKYWRVSPLYEINTYQTVADQHHSLQFDMGHEYKLSVYELTFALGLVKRVSFQGYKPRIIIPINDDDTVYD